MCNSRVRVNGRCRTSSRRCGSITASRSLDACARRCCAWGRRQCRSISMCSRPMTTRTPADELTPYNAERFFGQRYAREALDLDPSYQPAQVVLLSLILERTYRPKVPQILLEPQPPKLQQLLTTIDAQLATRVLDRGLEDRQVRVGLPLIPALGERGEFRRPPARSRDPPPGIARRL